VIGRRFTVAKRHVAMFCVALCMALSVQMTIVVLDRLQHTFQIAHEPNALAGPVFDHAHHLPDDVRRLPIANHTHERGDHGHHHDADPSHHAHAHGHDHESPPSGFHTHDWLPQGHDHGPITHHHHGSGMLTPWLVSATVQIVAVPVRIAVSEYWITGHPDAPAWRRDRPPKLNLDRVV
jgi:hypothetical protein